MGGASRGRGVTSAGALKASRDERELRRDDREMPVEKNAGRIQNKEQLNRNRLTLFLQQVEKEGPNRHRNTFTRSWRRSHGSRMFPHS